MSMFNKVTKTFQWGPHSVTLETGEIARQAGGAVGRRCGLGGYLRTRVKPTRAVLCRAADQRSLAGRKTAEL